MTSGSSELKGHSSAFDVRKLMNIETSRKK